MYAHEFNKQVLVYCRGSLTVLSYYCVFPPPSPPRQRLPVCTYILCLKLKGSIEGVGLREQAVPGLATSRVGKGCRCSGEASRGEREARAAVSGGRGHNILYS